MFFSKGVILRDNGLVFIYKYIVLSILMLINVAYAKTYDTTLKYLIENEFSGQVLGQYTSNPPQLGARILTNVDQ